MKVVKCGVSMRGLVVCLGGLSALALSMPSAQATEVTKQWNYRNDDLVNGSTGANNALTTYKWYYWPKVAGIGYAIVPSGGTTYPITVSASGWDAGSISTKTRVGYLLSNGTTTTIEEQGAWGGNNTLSATERELDEITVYGTRGATSTDPFNTNQVNLTTDNPTGAFPNGNPNAQIRNFRVRYSSDATLDLLCPVVEFTDPIDIDKVDGTGQHIGWTQGLLDNWPVVSGTTTRGIKGTIAKGPNRSTATLKVKVYIKRNSDGKYWQSNGTWDTPIIGIDGTISGSQWTMTNVPTGTTNLLPGLYTITSVGAYTSTSHPEATEKIITIRINSAPTIPSQTVSTSTTVSSGTPLTFTTKYNDVDGIGRNMSLVYVLIGNTANNTLYAGYEPSTNRLFLFNDAGTDVVGYGTPGSNTPLSNSQGTLNCVSVTKSFTDTGVQLTINWSFNPTATFIGTKNVWCFAGDKFNVTSGWSDVGDVTIYN